MFAYKGGKRKSNEYSITILEFNLNLYIPLIKAKDKVPYIKRPLKMKTNQTENRL